MQKPVLLCLLPLLATAACSPHDFYDRPGDWLPSGANAANLAVMVADPLDLVRGVDTRGADGQEMETAITRWRAGKPKRLLDAGPIMPSGSSSGTGAPN